MMLMTFMHYASRITLYSEHPTIDSSTRPHTKLTKFLTRNVKYMRHCTLPVSSTIRGEKDEYIFKNFLFR